MKTKIEWCDYTINPIKVKGGGWHCTKISEGCQNCYAERINTRFGNKIPYNSTPVEYELDLSVFDKLPKKPARVFIQSMGDLFHTEVSFQLVEQIFDRLSNWESPHTWLILTKRPKRMADFIKWYNMDLGNSFPYLHDKVWLGVTVESQKHIDRIHDLLCIPASNRFVSVEPMLTEVGLTNMREPNKPYSNLCYDVLSGKEIHEDDNYQWTPFQKLNWVICGAERCPKPRYMKPEWARSLLAQCREANVPFFMKQMSGKEQIPDDLNVREIP